MMSAEDVIESHPLRLLDDRNCLPTGEIGLLLARSGVGKSAALINFALDLLIQEKQVLHFSAGMTSEKAHQYYQEIFADLKRQYPHYQSISWEDIYQKFMVISYADADKMVADLDEEIQTILAYANVSPALILVDGLDFDAKAGPNLALIKDVARKYNRKTLASMRIHRAHGGDIDLDGPLHIARAHTRNIYYMDPDRNRIHLEYLGSEGSQELPIYFCPHDFIFKAN